MEKRLSELAVGEAGSVARVSGDGRIRRRLFDMGITPSAEIVVRRLAPLGDPMEITVRGYELTLRKSEAECVIMNAELGKRN